MEPSLVGCRKATVGFNGYLRKLAMNGPATKSQASYPRDPIVEAIIEVQFAAPHGDVGKLVKHFAAAYPGPQRRGSLLHVEADMGKGAVSTRMSPHQTFLPTEDGKALVGFTDTSLSIHVLAPYPGWAAFLPRANAAIKAYVEIAGANPVAVVSVRYMDHIKVPVRSPEFNLLNYLPYAPQRATSMPNALEAFHVVTQANDPDLKYTAVLTVASMPPTEDSFLPIVYDLRTLRAFEQPISPMELGPHLEFLHEREKLIFEDSITDMTRSLFQ